MHQSLIFVTLLFASSRFVIEAAVNPDDNSSNPCEGENCEATAEEKCVEDPNIEEPYKPTVDKACTTVFYKDIEKILTTCKTDMGLLIKIKTSGMMKKDCCKIKDFAVCFKCFKIKECETFTKEMEDKVINGLCKCVKCNEPKKQIPCPEPATGQPANGGGGENGGGNNSGGSEKNSGDSKHNGDGPKASGAGLKVAHLPYEGFLLILAAQLSLRVLLF